MLKSFIWKHLLRKIIQIWRHWENISIHLSSFISFWENRYIILYMRLFQPSSVAQFQKISSEFSPWQTYIGNAQASSHNSWIAIQPIRQIFVYKTWVFYWVCSTRKPYQYNTFSLGYWNPGKIAKWYVIHFVSEINFTWRSKDWLLILFVNSIF